MKRKIMAIMAVALARASFADFAPVALTPGSYNQDMVIEVGQPALSARSNATIDGGTNNTGNTWYEVGFNRGTPTSGLPAAGSTWTSVSQADHTYQMAPNYVDVPNGILIDTTVTNATWTFTSPAAYTALSFVASGGNGGGVINAIVSHQDGTTETVQFNAPDWFGGANPAWIAFGRVNANSFGFDTQASITAPGNPRLYSRDVTLSNTTSPVTKVELRYASGGANVHNGIFAVSGQAAAGGAFSPITVIGYNYDLIVEAAAPASGPIPGSTATLDAGVANTGNTWYEHGLNTNNPTAALAAPSGLPAAGSFVTNATATDHIYQLPASYVGNNSIFVDPANVNATITLQNPAAYSLLSFLAAAGNGPSSINVVVHHQDNNDESFTISVPDWFNGANPVITPNGRISASTGGFSNVGSGNPRIYGIDINLANTTSPVTTVDLAYASTGGRAGILALSGAVGTRPIIASAPTTVQVNPGQPATLNAFVTGNDPLHFQWQKGTNGVFVNLTDSATVSGTTTTNLTVTGLAAGDTADYRLIASNSFGSTTNDNKVLITAISPLQDVTSSTDQITMYQGASNADEGVEHAIDDLTSKYLNSGLTAGVAPFTGPIGLVVTPRAGRTIVSGLRIYTANDSPDRDPVDYKLEGTSDGGFTWTTISSGNISLPDERNEGGLSLDPLTEPLGQVIFQNTTGYISYRLSFNHVKNDAGALFQIGEVELLGSVDTSGFPGVTNPAGVTDMVGDTATFTVDVTGTPTPTVKWQRLIGSTWTDIVNGGNVSGATTTTLTLTGVALSDAGQIRAVASNSVGTAASAPATLRVLSSAQDVTSPGDLTTSVGDTTIGAPNGPGATDPGLAIDNTFAKYLNGGSGFNAPAGFPPFGGPAGLTVQPSVGPTKVTGLRIYTADANPERDPADYKLEGSNDGEHFTVISSGALNLPLERNTTATLMDPLTSNMQEVNFSNNGVYTTYRLTFNTVRDPNAANSVQVSEIELLGATATPTPNISITRNSAGTITINFEGQLQRTGSLTPGTTWTDVPGTGSVTLDATGSMGFFRGVFPQ